MYVCMYDVCIHVCMYGWTLILDVQHVDLVLQDEKNLLVLLLRPLLLRCLCPHLDADSINSALHRKEILPWALPELELHPRARHPCLPLLVRRRATAARLCRITDFTNLASHFCISCGPPGAIYGLRM